MTKDEEIEKKPPEGHRVEPHGIPLRPSKQVQVTLPNSLAVVLTQTGYLGT